MYLVERCALCGGKVPLMPKRPSKKAQRIAERLNPNVVKPGRNPQCSKNEALIERDAVLNRRYPEPNP